MKITIEIPDDFVPLLFEPGEDPARSTFENVVSEAYRHRTINKEDVGQLLGLEDPHAINAVIGRREVYDITLKEYEEETQAYEAVRARRAEKTAA